MVVTHTHADHWDRAASALLPRGIPILTQHVDDQAKIAAHGFTDVRVLGETLTVAGVEFTRTGGQHGSDQLIEALPRRGEVMGVVVRHPDEPVVYIAGDSVMNDHVREALRVHTPDVVVLNTGEAALTADGPIIMGPGDVAEVAGLAQQARIVAVHLESLNHCPATRADVRAVAATDGLGDRVSVPEDGETLTLRSR